MLDSFDPNVLLRNRPFDPFGAAAQGMQQGLAMKQNRQTMDMRDQSMQQDKNLMDLDINDPNFLQNAISASPDIARQLIKQQIIKQLGSGKQQKFAPNWGKITVDGKTRMAAFTTDDDGNATAKVATLPGGDQAEAYERKISGKELTNQRGERYIVDPITRERFPILNEDGTPMIDPNFLYKKESLKNQKSEFNRTIAMKTSEMNQNQKQFMKKMIQADSENSIKFADQQRKNLAEDRIEAKRIYEIEKEQAGFEEKYQSYENTVLDGINTIDQMIGNKDKEIEQHPGLSGTVGLKGGSLLFGLLDNPIWGTEETDFLSMYEKITGKAFTQAFESLKGGGTITEVEGTAATKSLFAAQTAQSEKAFTRHMNEFKTQLLLGLKKAKKKRKDIKPKDNPSLRRINSREGAIGAFVKKFGKEPNEQQIEKMMENMGVQ